MNISVVVPVYREDGVASLADDLLNRPDADDVEVIVVDGTPDRDAAPASTGSRWRSLLSAPGRSLQQNHGAATANGDVLLFVHADTLLPRHAFTFIRQTLADPSLAGGAFILRYADPSFGLRVIAAAANLRSQHTRVPYGDQALFVRHSVFMDLGGFAPIPIMEDLEFMTRLRRGGYRIRILPFPAITSPRRQLREGLLNCTLRNLLLRVLYHLGVPPRILDKAYRRHGD